MKVIIANLNIKSSTIEKSLESAQSFLKKLLGPACEETGLLLADKVKIWRLNNQVQNLLKVEHNVKESGIEIGNVDVKAVFSYLDGVADESDEFLQDTWANLFTNYLDKSKVMKWNVYPSILAQLSSNDVKLLMAHHNNEYLELHDEQSESIERDYANVIRLGLMQKFSYAPELIFFSRIKRMTEFASEFITGCIREEKMRT